MVVYSWEEKRGEPPKKPSKEEVSKLQAESLKDSPDYKKTIRMGASGAAALFHSIAQLAKILYLLGIEEPYKYMMLEGRKINLKKDEVEKPIRYIVIIGAYWQTAAGKRKLTELYLMTQQLVSNKMDDFFRLFGIDPDERLAFLTDDIIATRGLVYFASNKTVDDYFYLEVLPNVLNPKSLSKVMLKLDNVSISKNEFVDFRKLFNQLVEEGVLKVKDGYVYVREVGL